MNKKINTYVNVNLNVLLIQIVEALLRHGANPKMNSEEVPITQRMSSELLLQKHAVETILFHEFFGNIILETSNYLLHFLQLGDTKMLLPLKFLIRSLKV